MEKRYTFGDAELGADVLSGRRVDVAEVRDGWLNLTLDNGLAVVISAEYGASLAIDVTDFTKELKPT
jgi:hypothetical protein